MYVKITNGTPTNYTIGQLRRDNPNTSFPKSIPDEMLAEYDVYRCATQDIGEINNTTHQVVNGNIEQVDGVWTQLRTIEQRPLDEVSATIRSQRDRLLAEDDWVVIKAKETGGNLSAAFKEYRQALRDITEQDGFPYDITWPEKP